MGNILQVKRGAGKPDGKLAPYELGLDITDFQLYVGGSLEGNSYGKAEGIKVDVAQKANGAISIVDESGKAISMGSQTSPIYLINGKFENCGGATISGTIEKANMLSNTRTIGVNLGLDDFVGFNGQNNITTGVQGTLPISKGGTGATTQEAARANLGLGSVSIESVLPITKGGTGAINEQDARANLGLGSVATLNTIPVENGGTGASDVEGALTNLGIKDILNSTLKAKVATTILSNQGSVEVSCDGQPYFVFVKIDSSTIVGAWDLSQSGTKNSMYGSVGDIKDNWPTTVDFANDKIKITRNGNYELKYHITILYV